ncbi:DUF47 domain-containing protein [Candidatus Uhrbacteria bacterium]|nr:DUF47 domain-containing protein [Candidatus Uhrbacteria bacterium]
MRFFLPKENGFFTLFKKINDAQKEIAQLLKDFASHFPDGDEYEKKAKDIERQADAVAHEIIDTLNRTFITPFDREDIYLLTNELDDIVDLIENVIHNVGVYAVISKREEFDQFADLIIEASQALGKLLDHFQELKKTDLLTKSKIYIHELEDKGDEIFCKGLHTLFTNEKDARTLIQWKDILEDLENVMDKYQKVSDIIESIVVKTS